MRFNNNVMVFVVDAKKSGICFDRVATLGRQSLDADLPIIREVLKEFERNPSREDILASKRKSAGIWSEDNFGTPATGRYEGVFTKVTF